MIIRVRDTSADEIESRIDLESPRLTLNRCSVQSNIALLMTAVDIVGSHTKTHRVSETSGPLLVSSFPSSPFFLPLSTRIFFAPDSGPSGESGSSSSSSAENRRWCRRHVGPWVVPKKTLLKRTQKNCHSDRTRRYTPS